MGDACAVCGAAGAQRCGGCGETRYCGRDHQRQHWKAHRQHCRPFKVCRDAVLGRHLVATRDLRAGEPVLREAALAAGPAPASPAVCLGCLEPLRCAGAAVDCARCGWPLCGADACARSAAHRAECDVTAEWRGDKVRISNVGAPSHPMYAAVLALRLLWLRDAAPARWARVCALESHCELRRGGPRWAADQNGVAQLVRGFFGAGARFTEDEVMRVCGVMQVNGHEVPLVEPAYVAIYDSASLLEHSCRPNCCKSFTDEGDILIRTAVPVRRGEHLSISYTDALWGTANRRHHLHETKFFWCRCDRCADPTEFGTYFSALRCPTLGLSAGIRHHLHETKFFWCRCDRCADPTEFGTYFSALRCPTAECGGAVVPRRPVAPPGSSPEQEEDLDAMRWACVECTRPMPASDVFHALEEAGTALASLRRGDAGSCERFLARWGDDASPLAPDHFYLSDARLALAQLLGGGERGLAAASDDQLRRKEALCRRLLRLFDKLVPAEHRVRGLLRFELHAALAEGARRRGMDGSADHSHLRETLVESKRLLEASLELLRHEPACLPEGQIARQAERNLHDLNALLRGVHAAMGGDSPL